MLTTDNRPLTAPIPEPSAAEQTAAQQTEVHRPPTTPIPERRAAEQTAVERAEVEQTDVDPTPIPIPEVTLADIKTFPTPPVTLEDPTRSPIPDEPLEDPTPIPIPNATLAAFTSVPIPEEPLEDRTTPPIPEVTLVRLIQAYAKSYSAFRRWTGMLRDLSEELRAFAEDHPEHGISPNDVPHQQGFGKKLRERLEDGRIPGVMLEERRRIGKVRGWHLYSTRVL
jgi:hypothetical protein